MAGRFPGARDIDAFWRLVCGPRDAITRTAGRAGRDLKPTTASGRFVPATARLDDIDAFDHDFFGIHPREAAAMDPQHRVFMECAWHALENAGHAGARRLPAGVFAACGPPAYLWTECLDEAEAISHMAYRTGDATLLLNGNDPGLLPLRTAHALGLEGPAINVQSACSSGLVAVAQACQSLVVHESDLCLAGAAHIRARDVDGHYHLRGGIHSADGRCRPFDQDATGTVFADGAVVVVLRRLTDAIANGDCIHAVIRGWAVNNDGGGKASLSAPSARGQAAAVTAALSLADVAPESIGYVEAHGTGTRVGDTIELAGLVGAFGKSGATRCAIGSVKSHIGHLDVAAGLAGLVKTVLCLKHGRLAPSLHCENPLPEFDRPGFPFRVVRENEDWPADGSRRAGVSSLGVGGTNCHLVLEDWRETPSLANDTEPQLLTLSAKNPDALQDLAARYVDWLDTLDPADFADACYTSHVGRAHFPWRLAVAATGPGQARERIAEAAARDREAAGPSGSADDAARACLAGLEDADADRLARLDQLARLYERGAEVDWQRLHRSRSSRYMPLPPYPFRRSRHWYHGVSADDPQSVPTRIELPFTDEVRFRARWRPDQPAYLAHHRLFGTVVAPASGQLSELLAAGRRLRDDEAFALESVRFLRPLALNEGDAAEIQFVFAEGARPGAPVRLAASTNGAWHEHTRAVIAADASVAELSAVSVPACAETRDGMAFYRESWAQGADTGTAFRWLRSLRAANGVATGRITRPRDCPEARSPDPGLIEALFQLVYCCRTIETRSSVAESDRVLVPARIGRIAWRGETRGEMTGLAVLREIPADASSVIADLVLLDEDNRAVLSVEAFELRSMSRDALAEVVVPDLMTPSWRPAPLADGDIGSSRFTVLGEGHRAEALARLSDANRLSPGAETESSETLACLCPLAVRFDPDRDSPHEAVEPLLGELYALLHERERHAPGRRIVVVTRRAHDVPGHAGVCDPMQAAVWGFVRVAAREYPDCVFRLVDIDDASTDAELAEEIRCLDGETEIAYRNGVRYAGQLEAASLDNTGGHAAPCYVVCGADETRNAGLKDRLGRRGIDVETRPDNAFAACLPEPPAKGFVVTPPSPPDALIAAMPWTTFSERLSTALENLATIHRDTRRAMDLVLLIAGAAWTGNTGQATYAATGAFAAALAARRRAAGLPGRAFASGPWEDAGDWTTLDARRRDRLAADGFVPIATAHALDAFDAFFDSDLAMACVPGRSMKAPPAEPPGAASTTRATPARTPPNEAASDIERRLGELLAGQLGVEPGRIDAERSLSDLGIDSLDAVGLGDAIESALGVAMTIGDIVDADNLSALARLVESRIPPATNPATFPVAEIDESVLVRLTPGSGRPVFCVPADSSTALSLKPLADAMGLNRPLYALQAPGIDDDDATPNSVDALARRYVEAIRRVQPSGPYALVGRCSGGLAAYQAAVRLTAMGERIDTLVLIDTLPPGVGCADAELASRQARTDVAVRQRIDSLPPLARERFKRVQSALDRAVDGFRPDGIYAGRLLVIRGEQDSHPAQGEWRRFAAGGVSFVDLPGNHSTIFEPPGILRLATTVTSVLNGEMNS